MNRLFKNFKKLSVKEIKTYAALVLMSTLSIQATAFEAEKESSPEPLMLRASEIIEEEEMALESWMLSPFEVNIGEGPGMEALLTASSEAGFETELDFEIWMAEPFQIRVSEESACENIICCPAP